MHHKHDESTGEFGLLANGSAGRWSLDVDEAFDRDDWSLAIDGPTVYLVFQLDNLTILRRVLTFLQGERDQHANEDSMTLGRFGTASVSLLRDNEDFSRCFLVVGPRARSTFRVSLDADDIQQLSKALRQVVADLPD